MPINQTGTYSILAHSTLFGGHSTTEPVSIIGKFLNISAEQFPTQEELVDKTQINATSIPKITESDQKTTNNQSEIITETKSQVIQEKQIQESDNLILGLGIGIGIGLAIGIGSLLLIRQKP